LSGREGTAKKKAAVEIRAATSFIDS
jgi:hypothetical protein